MKKVLLISAVLFAFLVSCNDDANKSDAQKTEQNEKKVEVVKQDFPTVINIKGIAQNPEGIEFDKNDKTFLLSSLNAGPIIKVNLDGTYKAFTSGEKFPLSTAGLQIDYKNNRLLVAGFNGTELMDKDPKTKGTAYLRVYDLKTGKIEKDINLSSLLPEASAYFANDIAIDNEGNAYISDWYARAIYKVDLDGNASVFWTNETGIPSGANGLDFHPNGYLLVSILTVNDKGLYADYGLVKIPIKDPKSAKVVNFTNAGFTGFDGMVLKSDGKVVGVTNNGTGAGGNTFIEISSDDNWSNAKVINTKSIKASTTVAVTPDNDYYIINQDFTNGEAKNWTIEQIKF
jgi:sugar lactone lactonase YvrE